MLPLSMSAFRGKADVDSNGPLCRLMTQIGHSAHSSCTRPTDAVPWLSRGKCVMMPLRQKFQ